MMITASRPENKPVGGENGAGERNGLYFILGGERKSHLNNTTFEQIKSNSQFTQEIIRG